MTAASTRAERSGPSGKKRSISFPVQYMAKAAMAVKEMSMLPETITTSTPSEKMPRITDPLRRLNRLPSE